MPTAVISPPGVCEVASWAEAFHWCVCAGTIASSLAPQNNVLAGTLAATITPYGTDNPPVFLSPNSVTPVGGSQPHENMQPYLCISFIISLFGIFPRQP